MSYQSSASITRYFYVILALLGATLLWSVASDASDLKTALGYNTAIITAKASGWAGTGFQVVAPSGSIYFLTNAHVCNAPVKSSVFIDMRPTGLTYEGVIIAKDTLTDLCLVDTKEFISTTPIVVSRTAAVKGDKLYTAGYPHLQKKAWNNGRFQQLETFSLDVPVTAKEECPRPGFSFYKGTELFCRLKVTRVMTSVSVVGGQSGSPILNGDGELVGVACCSDPNGGLMVPLDMIKKFLHNY